MGWYRVLREGAVSISGQTLTVRPGQIVDIELRTEAASLLANGIIGNWRKSHASSANNFPMAQPGARTMRVGLWLNTTHYYSGGRLHLYQYALCLAQAGAEVYLLTDKIPPWVRDYPPCEKLQIVMHDSDAIPEDLDLVVTDSKGMMGNHAYQWKQDHPQIPFVAFNFETPNWVAAMGLPEVAAKMPHERAVWDQADMYIANSNESARFLLAWLEHPDKQVHALPPAVNTFALDAAAGVELNIKTRVDVPFVVWSARAAAYKCGEAVLDAVRTYPAPLDVVMIGHPPALPTNNDLHHYVKATGISDAEKFALMQRAVAALAPSLFEGFGMVPMEAMASGTPCIVYDLPVLRQAYGDTLIYAEKGNAQDFVAKVHATVKASTKDKGAVLPPAVARETAGKYGMAAMAKRIERIPHHAVRRKSVTAQMICYYGPTVHEAIEAIYPHVDQVVIAHGPTKLWRDFPADNSLQAIRDYPDVDAKIVVEARDLWEDKLEMRTWATKKAEGNHLLIVDADEIYVNLDQWLAAKIERGCPRWVHFWHDGAHFVYDAPGMARWGKLHPAGGSVHNHFRFSWWRHSYYWKTHCAPRDASGSLVTTGADTKAAVAACPECCIYHLGHTFDKALMDAKHEFYLARDGRDAARERRRDVWHSWSGKIGDCGDGIIAPVDWELPDIVQRALQRKWRPANV